MSTKLKENVDTAFRPGTQSGSRREVTIIKEGWGSSGYYPGEVLERDVPKAFPIGTPMYMNHPTIREDHERPERDVLDLVGKLVETPRMAGAESVSVAHIYEHWQPVIDALADDIGLSIVASGELKEGSAGGKTGPIIESIDEGRSVDFVTEAGAGGKVGKLIESARRKDAEEAKTDLERLQESIKGGTWTAEQLQEIESTAKVLLETIKPNKEDAVAEMSEADKKRLSDLEESVKGLKAELSEKDTKLAEEKKRGDRAEEALVLREAGKIADEIASEVTDLPSRAKARVISEALSGDLPVDSEGKLLESEFKEKAKKALKEEVEYISETSGKGRVRGAGSSSQFHESGSPGSSESDDEATTALQESFERRGMGKDAAKRAAEGR